MINVVSHFRELWPLSVVFSSVASLLKDKYYVFRADMYLHCFVGNLASGRELKAKTVSNCYGSLSQKWSHLTKMGYQSWQCSLARILLIDRPKILRYHKKLKSTVLLNFLSVFPKKERSLQSWEANAPFCFWPHVTQRSPHITSCNTI